MLAGGVASNDVLEFLCRNETFKIGVPTHRASKSLCSDNAAMIAWMGWELKYAEQDVDIRQYNVEALEKIPLGSFVEKPVIFNHKERNRMQLKNEAPSILKSA
jgi:tRNA A37 threonylcarbamoyltransferase TsaD